LLKVGEIAPVVNSRSNDLDVSLSRVEERALITRAKKGEPEAFERLIDETRSRVFALIGRMLDDSSAVEDVAQNAYLKAWIALPQFRGKSSFMTWVYRIAVNEALTHIRKEGRKRYHQVEGENAGERAVNRIVVQDALSRIPEVYRTAIHLSYTDDLTCEDAAKVMDVPVNTYKTYLHRGKIKLRKIIEGAE
jgi:RNA polymerase sigma-70 factor, ECF subfamily